MLTAKSKQDVFCRDTLDYVLRHLSLQGTRILEVGCGAGDFAYTLIQHGAIVTACDTNKDAVQLAQDKGVAALHTDFLSFEGGLFDAVIFTRSLHHMPQLPQTIQHAQSLLIPGGKLLVEEFDLEMIDQASARWYYDTRALVALCTGGPSYPYTEDPVQSWAGDHVHQPPLHTGTDMLQAIKAHFTQVETARNAYLYRSICGKLNTQVDSYGITEKALTMEKGLIQQGSILANGFRITARKV